MPLAAGSTLVWSKELGKSRSYAITYSHNYFSLTTNNSFLYLSIFKDRVTINIQNMFFEMALIIFIPLLASFYFKKKFIKNLNPNFSFIIIGIIINIAVSKSAEKLDLVKDYLIISIVISLIFIAITLLVLSLFSKGLGLKNEEKESIYMPSFFKNVSLAIIIVSFFEPEVVFFPVIYYIVEQIIPPIYYEIKKYNSEIFKLI